MKHREPPGFELAGIEIGKAGPRGPTHDVVQFRGGPALSLGAWVGRRPTLASHRQYPLGRCDNNLNSQVRSFGGASCPGLRRIHRPVPNPSARSANFFVRPWKMTAWIGYRRAPPRPVRTRRGRRGWLRTPDCQRARSSRLRPSRWQPVVDAFSFSWNYSRTRLAHAAMCPSKIMSQSLFRTPT
jgi:hypothetical protein